MLKFMMKINLYMNKIGRKIRFGIFNDSCIGPALLIVLAEIADLWVVTTILDRDPYF